jgi:hypothetical protein
MQVEVMRVEEFCRPGCQSNCSPPPQESCGDNQATALHRRIGYYEVRKVLSLPFILDIQYKFINDRHGQYKATAGLAMFIHPN